VFAFKKAATQYDLCSDQVEPSDASANQIETSDVVGNVVLGSGWKCECAFHVSYAFGVFLSDLHYKGRLAPYPGTGQQTRLGRPVDFQGF
jgi:hypothetical protein